MASGPNISWQIDGETMEAVTDFIFLGYKIMADGDRKLKGTCSLEEMLLTNLDSKLKSRDTTLFENIHSLELSFLWASLIAQLVKNPPAMQETSV